MVTTDEIRQRVEQADQARGKARVDTATRVAALVEQRGRARADLAVIEASTAAEIAAAGAVMTVDELVKFTGIQVGDLRVNGSGKAKVVQVRKVRAPRAPKAAPEPSALQPVLEPAVVEEPVQQ